MEEIINDFPKQFKTGLENASNIDIDREFKGLCICGMGGSALVGNLLNAWLNRKEIEIPLLIQRDYSLPHLIDKDWLVITISYSGNTEETLSCFKKAVGNNLNLIAMTSDGEIKNKAQRNGIQTIKIPDGVPPRMSLGYQFASLIQVLNKTHITDKGISEVKELEQQLNPKNSKDKGKEIAEELKDKIPIIYASNRLKILARIFKIKFNENSKSPSFWNYFPELNHNEMTGFETIDEQLKGLQDKFFIMMLKDSEDHNRIQKRMTLTKEMLTKKGLTSRIIETEGNSFLEKVFNTLLLGDWISFYLAKEYKIDPEPVEMVEEFKKKMK